MLRGKKRSEVPATTAWEAGAEWLCAGNAVFAVSWACRDTRNIGS
jgi:hypothetical protein